MQRVKEGFDARAISAIRRRAVKCSGETAQRVVHMLLNTFAMLKWIAIYAVLTGDDVTPT